MNNSSRGTDKRYTNAILKGLANLLNYRVLLIQELPENIQPLDKSVRDVRHV